VLLQSKIVSQESFVEVAEVGSLDEEVKQELIGHALVAESDGEEVGNLDMG
jgi:hypothetical protein